MGTDVGRLPAEPRLAPPRQREGTVPRAQLVARLRRAADVRLLSVVAPGGYGKTTGLAQWVATEQRPVAWVTLDPGDDDPTSLVRDVRGALEIAGLVTVAGRLASGRSAAAFWSSLVPEVRALLAQVADPFLLVLDDVHHAASREAIDLLGVLAAAMPPGCQLVLCGRAEVTAVVVPARAARDVAELGVAELRLSRPEARALLADVGVDVDEETADELNRRAEGWAAGLALGGLARRLAGDAGGVADFASLDRFVEDYLRVEHLSTVSRDELSFLQETAVLERLSPPLCDAVCERTDSRVRLEGLEAASRFVVALDHEREWFRYHDLFRATLLRELERSDAAAPARLRLRAAAWCAENGAPGEAIEYALAAGDLDLAARLFGVAAVPLWRSGHQSELIRWIELLDRPEVRERHPVVAALAGLVFVLAGDAFHAERWVDVARHTLAGRSEDEPGVGQLLGICGFADAALCRLGIERMLDDAAESVARLGEGHPMLAGSTWVQAVALSLVGRVAESRERLRDAVRLADGLGGVHAGIAARAWLAQQALADGELDEAEELLDEADAALDAELYGGYTGPVIVLAVRAHHDALQGRLDPARQALTALQRERPLLTHAMPWLAVTAFLEMARASLALGDAAGARAVLVDAADVLRHRPDLGVLVEEVGALQARASGTRPADAWATTLTAAELRLLPLLTTHLTFREIGERLFVSRNTVKTQAISIYRKLGASSRGEAVARASELGLVEVPLGRQRFTPGG